MGRKKKKKETEETEVKPVSVTLRKIPRKKEE